MNNIGIPFTNGCTKIQCESSSVKWAHTLRVFAIALILIETVNKSRKASARQSITTITTNPRIRSVFRSFQSRIDGSRRSGHWILWQILWMWCQPHARPARSTGVFFETLSRIRVVVWQLFRTGALGGLGRLIVDENLAQFTGPWEKKWNNNVIISLSRTINLLTIPLEKCSWQVALVGF